MAQSTFLHTVIFNNIFFSTTNKTPNKIAYDFSLYRLFDLLFDSFLSNIFQACTDRIDAISFAFFNQKAYYNQKH